MTNVTAKTRRDWRTPFLDTFGKTGNVLLSCHAAGISRQTAYRTRSTDTEFAAEWVHREDDATDALEGEARRRAMTTSDVLLIFLLKSRRPNIYRDNYRVEMSGPNGGPIQMERALDALDDAQREKLAADIDNWLAKEVE